MIFGICLLVRQNNLNELRRILTSTFLISVEPQFKELIGTQKSVH